MNAVKPCNVRIHGKIFWFAFALACVPAGFFVLWLSLQVLGYKAELDLARASGLVQKNFNLKNFRATAVTKQCLSRPPTAMFDFEYLNYCQAGQNLLVKVSKTEYLKIVDYLKNMKRDGWRPWGIEYYGLSQDAAYQSLFNQIAEKYSEGYFSLVYLGSGTTVLRIKVFDKTNVDYLHDPQNDLQGLDLLGLSRKDIPAITNDELLYVFNFDDTYLENSMLFFPVFKSILNWDN